MTLFVILQLLFDAALVVGMLFAFNFVWQKLQHRREDEEVLRNVELQELHAGLQELLVTVRQVGGEVSGRLHDKVREAEKTLTRLESILDGLRPEMEDLRELAKEMASEKEHLEAKRVSLKSTRRSEAPLSIFENDFHPQDLEADDEAAEEVEGTSVSSAGVGFPSSAVKEIYRMADSHMDVGEISRRTQLTRGEVQLILNLRSNRFTTPN
jgi:predicted nuclease with TOPRIM domain